MESENLSFSVLLYRRIRYFIKVLLKRELWVSVQRKMNVKWTGKPSYGFYIVPSLLSKDSIVYSFGIGEDISFDEGLIKDYECTVWGYDPTPKSKLYLEKRGIPDLFKYFEYGIANYDGNAKFYLPDNPNHVSCTNYNRWSYDENIVKPIVVEMKRLTTLMTLNSHRSIDLLKLDIEGSEYDVIEDILKNKISIKQICVEVHHRFPKMGIQKTKELIKKLNQEGYYIVAISSLKEEYTFVHEKFLR